MIGYINSIESFATMDGGGIRFMVFMQGCPLKCIYCHNVDTQFFYKENNDVINERNTNDKLSIKNEFKENTSNISILTFSEEELANKIIKNKHYYANNGGVTFSGGEPLLQSQFILDVIKILKEHKIHVAIDTSLCIHNVNSNLLLNESDLIIADIKFYNSVDYELYTKSAVAFDNLCKNLEFCKINNKKMLLRTVIIEGINDTLSHIDSYVNLINSFKGLNIIEYELLAFHTLGFSKYENLNIENKLINMQAFPLSRLKLLQNYLNEKFMGNEH